MDDRSQRLIDKADRALAQNNLTSATLALNKIRRQYPESPELHIRDARIAFKANDILTGTAILSTLSRRTDLSQETIESLVAALEQYELYFPLRDVIRRLLETYPEDTAMNTHYGQLLLQTGEVVNAIEVLKQSAEAAPADANTQLQLGHAYKALSDTENAAQAYRRYIQLAPEYAGTGYWSLADLKQYQFSENDILDIDNLSFDDTHQAALLAFARQRVAEQQDSTDIALRLEQANLMMSQLRPFNLAGFERLARDVRTGVGTPPAESSSPTPVFIVGLPRSGTTLTEQILAAHSQISTTDELPYIERIAIYLSQKGYYPSALHTLPTKERERCREFYLQQSGQYAIGNCQQFIDKNPNNFIHLGLIYTLFPEAKVLCLSRPVQDNIASLYRQLFSKGNDYTYRPEHLCAYIDTFYDLMNYWQSTLPGMVKIVDYEKLVEDADRTIRSLIDWCGLAFETQCLRFYEMDTPVLTPSASQVRQPINNKSIGGGKRFRELFRATTPSIEELESKRRALLMQSDQTLC